MRLEQHVWDDRCLYLFRRALGKARLRVGPDIRVRPAVKRAFFDPGQVIGRKVIAESVAFLDARVKLSRSRVECKRRRIAHTGGERRLA